MELLFINQISKTYGSLVPYKALDNISFTANEGDFVAIMGPSGSGKSTLLNIIAGILKPTSGEVLIGNSDITKLNTEEASTFRRNKLGFVFQNFNLVDTLTVRENIMLPLMFQNVKVKEMHKRAEKIAKNLGIHNILEHGIFEISGGQAQRTAIARGIIHEPRLLLADEPTGNLDSKAAKDVMQILTHLNQEQHMTTFIVTHDATTASYCKRVIFIKDGQIYNELHRGDNSARFYDEILSVLKVIGGI